MTQLSTNVKTTMSSLEIAELTGKDHKNVLQDIRKILAEVEIDTAEFTAVYKDQQLIDRPCFNLPFRETNLIISSYSVKHRLVIIDRWQELEEKIKIKKPDMISGFNNWNALKVEVPIPLKKLDMAALSATFTSAMAISLALDMNKDESALAADKLGLKEHGYSAIDLLGIRDRFQREPLRNGLIDLKHPIAEELPVKIEPPYIYSAALTATQIGEGTLITASEIGRQLIAKGVKRRRLSGRNINELFLEMGLLKGKPQQWALTERGLIYGSYVGFPHQAVRWYEEATLRLVIAFLSPLSVVV